MSRSSMLRSALTRSRPALRMLDIVVVALIFTALG